MHLQAVKPPRDIVLMSRPLGRPIVSAALDLRQSWVLMVTRFIFCLGDIDDVLASPTYEPFIQVFFNATQSYAGATVMTLIIAVMLTS